MLVKHKQDEYAKLIAPICKPPVADPGAAKCKHGDQHTPAIREDIQTGLGNVVCAKQCKRASVIVMLDSFPSALHRSIRRRVTSSRFRKTPILDKRIITIQKYQLGQGTLFCLPRRSPGPQACLGGIHA
ncbi:hypothetical protein AMTR_s00038p00115200 [Amborella trichopoda]|uniref:Uncharacterized protein n=1 Tax=Amborella trichopoda TaxID=13333 RepID=U5CXA7_AMBTC|nr:hypothetical protein AMTR_s00038p00115200 [Amborella trichopoda]